MSDQPTFDLREQIARIDRQRAEAARGLQIALAPGLLVLTSLAVGVLAGAALMAAAIAVARQVLP